MIIEEQKQSTIAITNILDWLLIIDLILLTVLLLSRKFSAFNIPLNHLLSTINGLKIIFYSVEDSFCVNCHQ